MAPPSRAPQMSISQCAHLLRPRLLPTQPKACRRLRARTYRAWESVVPLFLSLTSWRGEAACLELRHQRQASRPPLAEPAHNAYFLSSLHPPGIQTSRPRRVRVISLKKHPSGLVAARLELSDPTGRYGYDSESLRQWAEFEVTMAIPRSHLIWRFRNDGSSRGATRQRVIRRLEG
jgi:hypothetical protein